MSWIATTYLGACQNKNRIVEAWSKPLFEAFIAGAWLLHWTDDTLYWISKPAIHTESINGRKRLHGESHAAFESDVEDLFFWHGVLVPDFVILSPKSITIEHIKSEKNAEVRRIMIERFGEIRYIKESGLKPVAQDDKFGTIYIERLESGRPICRLRVVNRSPEPDGSFKIYWLAVNPEHYNGAAGKIPQAASASTWRTTPGGKELMFSDWRDYDPAVET